MSLRAILEGYATAFGGDQASRELVGITVRRRQGFQNDAMTSGGLCVLLDEPVAFGGNGEAPDPAEYLLAAIGASLSVTLTAHAALRGLVLDDICINLRSEIEGRSFFEPHSGAPAGLLNIVVSLDVAAAIDRSQFEALLADVILATPVMQTLNALPRIDLVFRDTRTN